MALQKRTILLYRSADGVLFMGVKGAMMINAWYQEGTTGTGTP